MRMRFKEQTKGELGNGVKFSFRTSVPEETTDMLCNPRRGWYQIFTFYADRPFHPQEIEGCFVAEEALALVRIGIGAYYRADLDEDAIMRIRQILQYFREKRKDVILRIVYDLDGKGLEREPSLFSQVERHASQISILLQEFADVIFVYQGILVGSWGEMHTSKFLSKEKLTILAGTLKEGLPEPSYLAVRKPSFYRMLHKKDASLDLDGNGLPFHPNQICLFDDAIFGSKTHMGTFGTQTAEDAGWEKEWNRFEELEFIDRLCRHVPNGGEAVYQGCFVESASLQEMIVDLKKMHITYLNRLHDSRLLEWWKTQHWESDDAWNQMNGLDYIGRHLGYRHCLKKVSVCLIEGQKLRLRMEIENVGFAPSYQKLEVWLLTVSEEGNVLQEVVVPLPEADEDSRHCFEAEMKPLAGKYYLKMRTVSGQREILLGNCREGQRGVLWGEGWIE